MLLNRSSLCRYNYPFQNISTDLPQGFKYCNYYFFFFLLMLKLIFSHYHCYQSRKNEFPELLLVFFSSSNQISCPWLYLVKISSARSTSNLHDDPWSLRHKTPTAPLQHQSSTTDTIRETLHYPNERLNYENERC